MSAIWWALAVVLGPAVIVLVWGLWITTATLVSIIRKYGRIDGPGVFVTLRLGSVDEFERAEILAFAVHLQGTSDTDAIPGSSVDLHTFKYRIPIIGDENALREQVDSFMSAHPAVRYTMKSKRA